MERQKTAVEILWQAVNERINDSQYEDLVGEYEQALALEREQIIDAATHFSGKMAYIDAPSPAELYFTTKYGKQ